MLSRFGLLLNTVVRIRRKEKVILQNTPHRMPKCLLTQKCQQYFLIQNLRILDRCAFAHCKIGIRRSTATSYKKKNHSGNRFNLEKSSFFIKVLKTYVFTQITEYSIVAHLHHPELKSRVYIQP